MSKFVFTGAAKIAGMHITRDKLEKVVAAFGHRFGTSVSASDAYDTVLVTDTPFSGSRKNAAAAKLGVQKITSEQFVGQMMAQGLTVEKLTQILS